MMSSMFAIVKKMFTSEDFVLVKNDVKTLYDYFDKHPALKGD